MMYDDLSVIEKYRDLARDLNATMRAEVKHDKHFWQGRCERLKKLLLARKLNGADLYRAVHQGVLTTNDANWIQGLPEVEKPPLGIEPNYIWVERRKMDLKEAIKRYADAEMEIPSEWLEEYARLCFTGALKESEDLENE